jgi:multimeric flavodoxin WrbA
MVDLKLLGICGSPRKGNSEFLLKRALEYAEKILPHSLTTEIFHIRGKNFSPCIHCNRCIDSKGECVQNDDFQVLRDKWVDADIIVYSVPVYHMGIPGQLKCFIDRLGHSLPRKEIVKKSLKAIGIIVQGIYLFSGQEPTIQQLVSHALLMGAIPVVPDQNIGTGLLGVGGWTSKDRDRNAIEKRYQQGEMEARILIEASETMIKRALKIISLLRAGEKVLKNDVISA